MEPSSSSLPASASSFVSASSTSAAKHPGKVVEAGHASHENGPGPGPSDGSSSNNSGASLKKSSSSSTSTSTTRIRRRNRMITSCLECRRRKLKCDRLHPCTNCARFKRDCVFLAPSLDSDARSKLMELKEKMNSLERFLEEDVAGKKQHGVDENNKKDPEDGLFGAGSEEEETSNGGSLPVPDDEKDLEPTPLAVQDAAYEDEADDEMYDLGFRVGKMRMNERVGGFFRPKLADELSWSLSALDLNAELKMSDPSFNPGPSYIAPRSDMFFGTTSYDYTLVDFLPSKATADRLMQQYWDAVYPVARVVHRPSFEKRYQAFWNDASKGVEPAPSLQAVVFAALFAAVISMPEHEVMRLFGVPRRDLIGNFQLGIETALGKAHFLRTTKTETLQAFVMYLIPMCRDEMSRAHSVLVGTAIRLAESMGFHRDPSEYGHPPVETHVRRLIWYQLCFLDLRTSEVQGPRVYIRREDYSTKFPLNLDDEDFSTGKTDDAAQFTDMTYTRIRLECQEMLRICFIDRLRLDKRKISVTQVLGKIESFRKAMRAKYGPLVNVPNPKPIQRAAAVMMSHLINRMYPVVLHRYHMGAAIQIPDRLRQIILTRGTQQLEDAIELETAPELQPWAWYSRATHQYHTALLLLIEVFWYPLRREADRIWRCLDYIYEIPPDLFRLSAVDSPQGISRQDLVAHRDKKARWVLGRIVDRLKVYGERRKMKAPTAMGDTIPPPASDPQFPTDRISHGPDTQFHEVSAPTDRASQQGPSPTTNILQSDCTNNNLEPGDSPSPSLPQNISFPTVMFPSSEAIQRAQHNLAKARIGTAPSAQNQTTGIQYNISSFQQYNQHLSYGGTFSVPPPDHPPQEVTTSRAARGQSLESEATESTDSGNTAGLWFLPGVTAATAGTALQTSPLGVQEAGIEDLPMPDINWNEWDKLFPPHINNGDINLPPQSLSGIPTQLDPTLSYATYPYQPTSSSHPPY